MAEYNHGPEDKAVSAQWEAEKQESLKRDSRPKGDSRFHDLLRQIGELHDKKQQDYGADEDPFANVRASERWGIQPWVGALVRLNDKVHRLQQFAKKGELANESAEDSMLDIAVYSLIALILYREETEQVTDEKLFGHLKGVRQVGAPTEPFKHEPCQRCQTERDERPGQTPGDGLTDSP